MRILLFGDLVGIPQLLRHIPTSFIAGVVGAAIRPSALKPLAELAESADLRFLIQPKWKSSEYKLFLDDVADLSVDLLWSHSYSMIIRDDVLSAARLGGLNIHHSLLPMYRGPNPTQWSILDQKHETGVTLHEIDSELDAGPIVDQHEVAIFIGDTWLDVAERLELATDDLLRKNVPKVLAESWISTPQNNAEVTVGQRRRPEDGEFNWSEAVIDIHNEKNSSADPASASCILLIFPGGKDRNH